MIIKKWNGTGWDEQYPKTTANQLFDSQENHLFDSNTKIKPRYLPDSVFDSLIFYGTTANGDSRVRAGELLGSSFYANRSVIGYYYVASSPFTLTKQASELTTVFVQSGTWLTTNGSAVITATVGGAADALRPGLFVSGSGIPTGTTVLSASGSTATLSANATLTQNEVGITLTFQAYVQASISFGEESNVFQRSFTTTTGSSTVTTGNTSYLKVGMAVSGTTIPAGATIASITNATTFVLSVNALTPGGAQSLTFTPTTNPGTVNLETGDWFIITQIVGQGTLGSPYTVTFSVVNNTYEIMKAASASLAGAPGLVPASAAGDQNKFLRADGSWQIPIDTNTTYSAISTSEIDSGTDTNGRLITGERANYLLRNNVTATTTASLGIGATVSGATKTVNLGTGGASGSTTNVSIGSAVAGSTTINSPTTNVSGLTAASSATTGNVVAITGNSLTSGSGLTIQSTAGSTMVGSLLNVVGNGAITDGELAKFSSTGYVGSTSNGLVDIITSSTARTTGSSSLYIASTGANGTASVNTIGETISVKNTGTTSINTGLSLDVSGAATNRAINVVAGDTVLQAMSAAGGTFSGDVAVNGGDITTSAATFGLIDTTATTVNAFGAAVTLNLGNDGTGAASTTNIATGAISTTLTKAINIGTGGAGTSTTTITLGSATSSSQVIINSTDTQIRAAAAGTAATYFPVFTADPTTTGRQIKNRTAAQVLSDIGAAASSHTHTITANATDGIFDLIGTNGTNAVTYAVAPYTAGGTTGRFNSSTTAPTLDTRLNWEGHLYATKIFAGSTELFNRVVEVNNTSIGTNTLDLKSGEGITVTASNGDVTFAQTYPVYHADTLPTTGTISNNAIGFEW
jgi:hypothetical protein